MLRHLRTADLMKLRRSDGQLGERRQRAVRCLRIKGFDAIFSLP